MKVGGHPEGAVTDEAGRGSASVLVLNFVDAIDGISQSHAR